MTSFRSRTLAIPLSLAVAGSAAIACGDDAADSLSPRRGSSSSSSSSGSTSGGVGDPNDPNNPNNATSLSPEELAFSRVKVDLEKNCGKTCHDTGTYSPPAPMFLAGPDVYKSIKSHPGIVVRDVYASALLTKGPHLGPAVSSDAEFEKKVLTWLEAEAVAIQAQALPSTPPVTVVVGPNDIDLTPACVGGLTGVHLKFEAAMVGTMLSLSKLTLVAPAGSDVHILQPRFVRVLPKPNEVGATLIPDPADSFSNSDQTIPNGKETALAPGSVLFSGASWRPFDLAADKLKIEITKLEPGKVSVIAQAATCKNVANFTANVLPTLRNTGTSSNNNCQGCHGGGLGGLNLNSQDNALICQQVLQKLNQANIGQSLIVTKVTGAQHGGGAVADANTWRQLFVGNAAVFF